VKTLDEYNEEARKRHAENDQPSKSWRNGVACPKCGCELWDTNPMLLLTSNPPQKNVHCTACGYVGYRVA
jgi:hypothetical protein